MNNATPHSSLVSTTEVKRQTGLSSTSLWRKAKNGSFPAPVYLGQKKMWYQHQIDTWLDENLKTEPQFNNLSTHAKGAGSIGTDLVTNSKSDTEVNPNAFAIAPQE